MAMMAIAFSSEPEPRHAPTARPISGGPEAARGRTGTRCGAARAGQRHFPTCSVTRAGVSPREDQKGLRGGGQRL